MLSLPINDLRDMIDTKQLADFAQGKNMVTYREVKSRIRNKTIKVPVGAKSLNIQCVKADGAVLLLSIGKRGGIKKLWTFGKI